MQSLLGMLGITAQEKRMTFDALKAQIDRWRRQPHAAHEFIRLFVVAMFRHRKRGNRHIPPLGIIKSWRLAQCGRAIVLGPPYRRLRWMGPVCVLAAAVLSGCAGLTAIEPLLGGALGGLGGGGSATLNLQIDQAHGTLTMGNPPALTMTPVGTPMNPGSPVTPTSPLPPTSGSPVPVPLPPISPPNPVPVVP